MVRTCFPFPPPGQPGAGRQPDPGAAGGLPSSPARRDQAPGRRHRPGSAAATGGEQNRISSQPEENMMSPRTTPPFRADHVGSLLRPASLRAARDDFAAGRIGAAQLRAIEDDAITAAVAMQASAGLQTATDGEFRRASWHMDFIYQLGGVSKTPGNLAVKFHNPGGDIEFTPAAIYVDGKIKLNGTIFGDDFAFLQSVVGPGQTAKLTIPSPNMVHYRGGPAAIDPAVYPDIEEFWADLAAAYADEVARIAAQGCTYLQFDDTSLAYLNDPAQRAEIAARGEDAEHLHLRYISQVNAALAGRPAGLTVTTHLCRGNFRSSWAASGGYDFVAEALFSGLAVDGFFLEYDDDRSGGFEPLRFVPPGKMVVLGLVTTKNGELENADDLKRRIDAAARYLPLDQLALSGQCGFSSTVEGNVLTHDQQRAKLDLIVSVAHEVWG
jgi:methionine synthase II (cobalamin-independent)